MEGGKDVVRKTREQVDDEPAFEVVHADDARLRHHLACRADERHVEIEEDVDEEDDVDETVDHQHRHVVHRLDETTSTGTLSIVLPCVTHTIKIHFPSNNGQNYNVINVVALERLPEKHYAH